MDKPNQFQTRLIQAKVFNDIYLELVSSMEKTQALEIIRQAIAKDAYKAGRAYALQAPDAPDLAHFSTVVELWQEGNVLDIEKTNLNENVLDVTVTRCGYVQAYQDMGLESELIRILSCPRDAAFAKGYSEYLTLERPKTIAKGYSKCGFHYVWNEDNNG